MRRVYHGSEALPYEHMQACSIYKYQWWLTNPLEPDFLNTNPVDVLPKTTAAESEIYASSQLA